MPCSTGQGERRAAQRVGNAGRHLCMHAGNALTPRTHRPARQLARTLPRTRHACAAPLRLPPAACPPPPPTYQQHHVAEQRRGDAAVQAHPALVAHHLAQAAVGGWVGGWVGGVCVCVCVGGGGGGGQVGGDAQRGDGGACNAWGGVHATRRRFRQASQCRVPASITAQDASKKEGSMPASTHQSFELR